MITGPSGSGKSTLLKSMLLFEALDEGSLWYGEQQLDASNIASYRQNCAYIGQKAPGFEGTVKQFVTLPYTFRANRNHAPQPDEIRRLLLKFDFSPEIQATQFDCLSGGEQQRMCIIQALLLRRTILMLDEITSSLDAANSARVIEEINQLKGCTVIVVSHDIQWLQAGMRKLTLRDGALFGRRHNGTHFLNFALYVGGISAYFGGSHHHFSFVASTAHPIFAGCHSQDGGTTEPCGCLFAGDFPHRFVASQHRLVVRDAAGSQSFGLASERDEKGRLLLVTFPAYAISVIFVLASFMIVFPLSTIIHARYLIPLGGMVLGNLLRGNIIGFDRFYTGLQRREYEYIHYVTLGATRWEAVRPFMREAYRAAMAPQIAGMATIGLVALPGMMTGQILGGSTPTVAIKYQIMIMVAIYVTMALSVFLALVASTWVTFDCYGRLRRTFFVTRH